MTKIAIFIPARLGSTRLPNKILADINGQAMILRVCQQAKLSGYKDIIVACCEQEVADLVKKHGYNAVMTDPDLPSGTDRIYQAFKKMPNNQDIDIIVNLQGDLPNIEPKIISDTIEVLENNPDADIATAVVAIKRAAIS